MIQLLGRGISAGPVAMTRDEFRAVKKLYGYTPEPPASKPAPPDPLPPDADHVARDKHKTAVRRWQRWEDPHRLMQAGADRNAIRHAECDGLRMLAWIAKFVPAGEDPVRVLVQLAAGAGWDVDPEDVEWAEGIGDENACAEVET